MIYYIRYGNDDDRDDVMMMCVCDVRYAVRYDAIFVVIH